MCGIVGYIGPQQASTILVSGLKRLEYRGYDSAGIAVLQKDGPLVIRTEGKMARLIEMLQGKEPNATIGIGHTRWATHGKPSAANAHPHRAGRVILVHNGIFENYRELKERLPNKGQELTSETDSEVISHLISQFVEKGLTFLQAIQEALSLVKGTYSIAVLDAQSPSELYTAKKGAPLVIGIGEGEMFVASDIPAFLPFTKKVIFMDNDEIAALTSEECVIYDQKLREVSKLVRTIEWTADMAEKGGHKHFMLKEIMEQSRAIQETLVGRIDRDKQQVNLPEIDPLLGRRFPFNRFYIVACGTSWHAAMAGRYYIEAIAKIPVSVDTASEFRYREPFIDSRTLLLVISQSGETADTLACVEDARDKGATVIAICNVLEASIPRASHATLYTRAGPEIGVASTKAFTTQLTMLLTLALYLAQKKRSVDGGYLRKAIHALQELPKAVDLLVDKKDEIEKIAQTYHAHRDFYFIARGVHYPIALEGALKLKEISYVHAEGYAAGEMKHGPIALIEPGIPVVALAPEDRVCEKMISNIQEVKARGASIIVFATEGDARFKEFNNPIFYLPRALWYITPILASIPLQLLAYYIACLRGTNVDQPRNLAKSVTVE